MPPPETLIVEDKGVDISGLISENSSYVTNQTHFKKYSIWNEIQHLQIIEI